MRRAAWLLAATACASSPPPPRVAPVEVAARAPSVDEPPRPSMLSGTPARIDVKTSGDVPLDPCKTASGESDGVRVTTVECNAFDGASAFAWGPDATYAGISSQSSALLVTFPNGGAPRLERFPFWAAVSLSPRSDGIDVATPYEWQSLVRGKWTPMAQLPNGVTALAWVWEGSGPRIWARTGGTLGTAIETFRWVNGAWTRTPFWPSPARKGSSPAVLDATRLGDALFFSYVPMYDGKGGLFIEPEGGAPVRALTSVAPSTRNPSLAVLAHDKWPLVAVKSGDDLVVAAPAAMASGVSYTQNIIPGAGFAALARTPPARSDREPVMRDGVARCSEAIDSVSSDRLFSPVLVTRSSRALLLFVRHHVERRHRWTLIPTRATSFCDWLEERAVETTEVVVAELVAGPTPSAREVLAIPIRARVFDMRPPRLGAAFVGDALDVVVAVGPVLEHMTIDARRLP